MFKEGDLEEEKNSEIRLENDNEEVREKILIIDELDVEITVDKIKNTVRPQVWIK